LVRVYYQQGPGWGEKPTFISREEKLWNKTQLEFGCLSAGRDLCNKFGGRGVFLKVTLNLPRRQFASSTFGYQLRTSTKSRHASLAKKSSPPNNVCFSVQKNQSHPRVTFLPSERERASERLNPQNEHTNIRTRVTIFEIHHNIHLKWRACSSASEDNREIARARLEGSFDDGPLQLILFKAESAVPKIKRRGDEEIN